MNITDRHEMTGKDQNQSEGKVASDLLTYACINTLRL